MTNPTPHYTATLIRIEWDARDSWDDDAKAMFERDVNLDGLKWELHGKGWCTVGSVDDPGELFNWLIQEGFEGFAIRRL